MGQLLQWLQTLLSMNIFSLFIFWSKQTNKSPFETFISNPQVCLWWMTIETYERHLTPWIDYCYRRIEKKVKSEAFNKRFSLTHSETGEWLIWTPTKDEEEGVPEEDCKKTSKPPANSLFTSIIITCSQ